MVNVNRVLWQATRTHSARRNHMKTPPDVDGRDYTSVGRDAAMPSMAILRSLSCVFLRGQIYDAETAIHNRNRQSRR